MSWNGKLPSDLDLLINEVRSWSHVTERHARSPESSLNWPHCLHWNSQIISWFVSLFFLSQHCYPWSYPQSSKFPVKKCVAQHSMSGWEDKPKSHQQNTFKSCNIRYGKKMPRQHPFSFPLSKQNFNAINLKSSPSQTLSCCRVVHMT